MHLSILFIILLLCSAVVSVTLAVVSLRHRTTPSARPFALVLTGSSIWSIGYLFEILVPTPAAKLILDNFQFIGSDCLAIGSLLFALAYTGRERWQQRLAPLLWALPILNLLFVWSDPYHHLLRTSITVTPYDTLSILTYGYGPWMWLSIGYSYLFVLASIVLLIAHTIHHHRYYQSQTLAVLTGLAAGIVGNIFTIAGLVPIPDLAHLDITPLIFIITHPIWAWGIFHQRLFDLVPIARDVLIEHIPDGVLVVDQQQRIVDVNPGAQSILGQPATTLISQPIQTFLPLCQNLLTTDTQRTWEGELPCPAPPPCDTPLWAEVSVSRLTEKRKNGDPGRMRGWLLIIRNRTAQHQMQQSLRQSQADLSRAQEIAGLGSFRQSLATGISIWSANLSRLMGLGHQEREMTLEDIFARIHPDDVTLLKHAYEEIVTGQRQRATLDVRAIRPDGTVRIFTDMFEAIYDEQGHVIGTFGITQDVTERKHMEQELRQKQTRLQAIFDSAGVGIVIGDAAGHYTFINPYALTMIGYTADEFYQLSPLSLTHPDELHRARHTLQQILRGEIPGYREERRYRHKDGHYIWTDASVTATYNDQGQLESILSVMVDITERKHIEEELHRARENAEAANRTKSTFLANMSHELRTPLNAILGFTQIMTRSPDLPTEHREYVDIIHRSGRHLLSIINDVLDMSKIEAGQITLNERMFDLPQLLHEIEDMFKLRAREKGLQFAVNHDPALPRLVYADEMKLRQILLNLLSNAVKFTRTGHIIATVTLDTTPPPDYLDHHTLHVQVEDTGPGIAPDDMPNLFQAFTQTRAGQQFQEGTGLGLSISRHFVQLMGGDIHVQSIVGQGATFSFAIRIQPVEDSDHPDHHPPSPQDTNAQSAPPPPGPTLSTHPRNQTHPRSPRRPSGRLPEKPPLRRHHRRPEPARTPHNRT